MDCLKSKVTEITLKNEEDYTLQVRIDPKEPDWLILKIGHESFDLPVGEVGILFEAINMLIKKVGDESD